MAQYEAVVESGRATPSCKLYFSESHDLKKNEIELDYLLFAVNWLKYP